MLRVESEGSVWWLTLSRPDVRNAFNEELISTLHEAVVRASESARAIVIAGDGKAFCAGGDLQWMRRAAEFSEEQNTEDALRLARLYAAIAECPAVVIARVHGPCFGGGCGLVAAADVAIASTDATFAFSEVRLGLVPATISPFILQKVGPGHARALFTTGEAFDAHRALRIGLIHEVTPLDSLDGVVDGKLRAVLGNGSEAVALSKRIAQQAPMPPEAAARLLAQVRSGAEAREGITAFLDKRQAKYVEHR